MNSMPQHAVAKGRGQREFFRAHPTMVSRRVVRKSAPAPPPVAFGSNAGSLPDLEKAIERILLQRAAAAEPGEKAAQPKLTV
jgi:hypothetical protein